jgi:hypothetical protein
MSTVLESFAATYRLRITRDVHNRRIVAGRGYRLIADDGDGRLSVLLVGIAARTWRDWRRMLVAAGCRLDKNGYAAGSLSFEPSNKTACLAAIRAAGCKRCRVPTEAQLAALRRILVSRSRRMRPHSSENAPPSHVLTPRYLDAI